MSGTVRAAVLDGPSHVHVERVALADLDASAVRVAVEGCGVCGSNLPVWEGRPWFHYPLPPGAPGHEGWGRVEAVGDDVVGAGINIGDPVGFLSEAAFAEVVDVPADRVLVLPPSLDGVDFPGEALGCGFNVATRARFEAGHTVAVIGIGFLGAVITAVAAHAGARVVAISRRDFALQTAKSMGATDLISLPDPAEVVDHVARLTGGRLCDTVVEAVGLQAPLDLATQLTGFGGRLVVAGFHQDGPRQVDMQLWNWRGIDVINAHERDPQVSMEGMRRAAEAIAGDPAGSGWLDPSPLYTHRYRLDELGAAMEAMRQRPDGFLKALIRP